MNISKFLPIRRNPDLRIATDRSCDYDPSSMPLRIAMALVECWIENHASHEHLKVVQMWLDAAEAESERRIAAAKKQKTG
jgi:hypothetical protein